MVQGASPRIALLLTGNELMTGDIVDSNSAKLAEQLLALGFSVAYKATVADDMPLLVAEIERISREHDVLIINGGLGPTVDDLTAQALAQAAGVGIAQHPQAYAHLEQVAELGYIELSPANLKQADLPEGCEVIPNSMGTAVGFSLRLNDCLVMCTPGVPRELFVMAKEQIYPQLDALYPERKQPTRKRLRVFGMGESALQQLVTEQLPDWPAELELGFRASMPLLELKLQLADREQQALLDTWQQKVEQVLGAHIVTSGTAKDGSHDARSLPAVVFDLLREQGKQFTCAESCTGGLVASQMTALAGASEVFEAGFVTYSNAIKQSVVDVSSASLEAEGAVSEPVVREMLSGALERSGADLGVAISGIAGPGGGTADKPVGLVWLAWGSHEDMRTIALVIPGNRTRFQHYVAAIAYDLTRRFLLGLEETPRYFIDRSFDKRS